MEDTSLIPLVHKKLSSFVEDTIRNYIDAQLKAGNTKLPPEVELAKTLSVSRTTVRRALSDLENKGVIRRIHGKGTFINPNLHQARLNLTSGLPLPRLIELCGFHPSVKLLYHFSQEASPMQRSSLLLKENDSILTICKTYCADSTTVVLLVDDIPSHYLTAECTEEEFADSTFELIRKYAGVLCVRDEVQVSTADSGSILAYSMGKRILDCESALFMDIVNYTEDNTPVFLSKIFFNTSYIKFNMVRTLDVYD